MKKTKTREQAKPAKPAALADNPSGYTRVLADLKQMIAQSRRRALATVNRELVLLY